MEETLRSLGYTQKQVGIWEKRHVDPRGASSLQDRGGSHCLSSPECRTGRGEQSSSPLPPSNPERLFLPCTRSMSRRVTASTWRKSLRRMSPILPQFTSAATPSFATSTLSHFHSSEALLRSIVWTRSATSTSTGFSAQTTRWNTTRPFPTSSSPPSWVRVPVTLPRSLQRASELNSGEPPRSGDHAVLPSRHGVQRPCSHSLQGRKAPDRIPLLSADVRLRLLPPEADPPPFPRPSPRTIVSLLFPRW